LRAACYNDAVLTVFRVVLANPLTTEEILSAVLEEQCAIVEQPEIKDLLAEIKGLFASDDQVQQAC